MKYYYIDTSDRPVIDVFIPRIPESRMTHEDDKTPRICLSTSIEGCLTAAPWGWSDYMVNHPDNVIYRMYEFGESQISERNILTTEQLTEENLVPDAVYTNEVWVINQALIPDKIYYIIIDEISVLPANKYDWDIVESVDYRKVNNIIPITELYFDDNHSFTSSWTNYILSNFTYASYGEIDIEKKKEKVKLMFPNTHMFAQEHLESLIRTMNREGVILKYR